MKWFTAGRRKCHAEHARERRPIGGGTHETPVGHDGAVELEMEGVIGVSYHLEVGQACPDPPINSHQKVHHGPGYRRWVPCLPCRDKARRFFAALLVLQPILGVNQCRAGLPVKANHAALQVLQPTLGGNAEFAIIIPPGKRPILLPHRLKPRQPIADAANIGDVEASGVWLALALAIGGIGAVGSAGVDGVGSVGVALPPLKATNVSI